MAVKLRLRREGTKKKPHFRIVAADHRAPRDGRFIEIIGHYHPMQEPSGVQIDAERALHWLRHGAQPTSQVEKLLRITGVWEEFKPGDEPERPPRQPKERVSKKQREKAAEAEGAPPAQAEPAKAQAAQADPAKAQAAQAEPEAAEAEPEPADAETETTEEGGE